MYWSSPLVAKAVTLGLVEPRRLGWLARRVCRHAGDMPSCDLIWAEELVSARFLSRYQANSLLSGPQANNATEQSQLNSDPSPLKIGPYVVLDRVGRSDLGATYRCRRSGDRELVAVKLIDSRWTAEEQIRVGIAAEARRWAELHDPRVVSMERVELESNRLGFVGRWVAGRSMHDWLRAGRRMSPEAAAMLVRELIAVLAAADSRGLVHGDLTPTNLLIDDRGRIHLTDGGIRRAVPGAALIAERNLPPERYDYVAPEVAAGESPPDAASDIYSIGCLLYHLIAGRPPFFGGSAERKLSAHRAGRLADLRSLDIEIGPDIRLMLQDLLVADRSRRANSYNDLLSRLSPGATRTSRRLRAELRGAKSGSRAVTDSLGADGAIHRGVRWGNWLIWTASAAATVVAVMHGSARLMPLLSLRPTTRSAARSLSDPPGSAAPSRTADRAAVTALWNATEDLRR